MEHMSHGKLIVIDGGDGSGKKTQTRLLVDRLKHENHEVETLDFPQYVNNHFGRLLRECLDGEHGDFLSLPPKIASALYAADRFESKNKIEAWLHDGKTIILDRYVSSNMLHQGGKIADGDERKEFLMWLDAIEHEVFAMPRPDLIVYCAVDPQKRMELLATEAAMTSVTTDAAENDLAHQEQTDVAGEQIVADLNHWQRIDCMNGTDIRSKEDIHEDIYQAVKAIL